MGFNMYHNLLSREDMEERKLTHAHATHTNKYHRPLYQGYIMSTHMHSRAGAGFYRAITKE